MAVCQLIGSCKEQSQPVVSLGLAEFVTWAPYGVRNISLISMGGVGVIWEPGAMGGVLG